jgi:hypothetical protein
MSRRCGITPAQAPETRKHILRTAIVEIVAKVVGDTIDLVVHWQGGDHTQLTVPKNRAGRHRWTTEAETGELIRALARQQPDAGIAAILNRCGKCTGKGPGRKHPARLRRLMSSERAPRLCSSCTSKSIASSLIHPFTPPWHTSRGLKSAQSKAQGGGVRERLDRRWRRTYGR